MAFPSRQNLLKYLVMVFISFVLSVFCFTVVIQGSAEIVTTSASQTKHFSFPIGWSFRFAFLLMVLAYVFYFIFLLLSGRNDLFWLKLLFGVIAVVAATGIVFWPLISLMTFKNFPVVLGLAAFGSLIPVFNRWAKRRVQSFH